MIWSLSGSHAQSRRDATNMKGSALATEPLAEAWALSAVDDAAWEPPVVGDSSHADQTSPALLANGYFFWRVFSEADSLTGYGWDTTPTAITDHDLDDIDVELAWDGESEVFQSGQAKQVGVCRGCEERVATNLDAVFGGAAGTTGPSSSMRGTPRAFGHLPTTPAR